MTTSEFSVLEEMRDLFLSKSPVFSWRDWFTRHLRRLGVQPESTRSFQFMVSRAECVLQAVRQTGMKPSVSKLVEVMLQHWDSRVRDYLADIVAEHLATWVLNINLGHSAMTSLLQAARQFQIASLEPELCPTGDESVGIQGELTFYLRMWLSSLGS